MTQRRSAAVLASAVLLASAALAVDAPAQAESARGTTGFFAGKVINPATGNPVGGVTVKVFRINSDELLGRDRTGSAGRYRINGLSADDEELDVRVNGSAVGYETGWVSCANNVVSSWGAACSHGQGRQSPIKIQHL